MKNHELLDLLGEAGEDYVRAAGENVVRPKFRWKTIAAAACLCLALAGTALAASPELRALLETALGSFAPYAHEQKGEAYAINGMEFRVVSALADDFTVRAYVEVRDLEEDRLSKLALNEFGCAFGLVDIPTKGTGKGVTGFVSGATCLGYDAEAKTALLAVTSWGQVMADDLSGSEVKLFDLRGGPDSAYQVLWENSGSTSFPVEIRPVASITMGGELVSALRAEEVRLSPIGLSVLFKGDEVWPHFAGVNAAAQLADGTRVDAPWEGGQGSFGTYGTESSRKVLVWNFRDPVDIEQITGIYVGEDYFPIS